MIKPQILLVEDNPDDVELTLLAFDRSKIKSDVVVVTDGQAALDYLFSQCDPQGAESTSRLPQVVLLDLNLPKLNGLEVLRALRADPRTKRLPVVMLTSSNEYRDVAQSYDLGANSYVRKPVDFAEFLVAAEQLGSYWLALNHPPPPEAASVS